LAAAVRFRFSSQEKVMKTVVGVFDSNSEAQDVKNALVAAGIRSEDVEIYSAESGGLIAAQHTEEDRAQGGGISGFFRRLFGFDEAGDEQVVGTYSEAIRRGSCVVSAHVDSDAQAERVDSIMHAHGAIDIEARAEQWRAAGWTGYQSDTAPLSTAEIEAERQRYASGKQTIPVVEEELHVGKRQVGRGHVRVFTHISERPVEETVRLREEHATVQRHRVDRPATEADMAAMKEGTIEINETAEEAVVEKTARVVEEVDVSKEASEHTETVRDTVRRTDVEVEENAEKDVAKEGERSGTRRKGPGSGQRPQM
jgi:uncharacterized protein (TIGR02271 family)